MVVESFLYLFAYPKLRRQEKKGWDYLFYGVTINIMYVVTSLFTTYGTFIYVSDTLVGSVIGLYFLFQIRESYLGPKRAAPTRLPKEAGRS